MSTSSFGADNRMLRPASKLWPPAIATASAAGIRQLLVDVRERYRSDVAKILAFNAIRSMLTAAAAVHLVFEIDHGRAVVVPSET